jgi:hypothetical protein
MEHAETDTQWNQLKHSYTATECDECCVPELTVCASGRNSLSFQQAILTKGPPHGPRTTRRSKIGGNIKGDDGG